MNTLVTTIGLPTALLILVTLCYLVTCGVWPFKPCRTCKGTGRFRSALLGAVRLCRRCKGTGLRLRLGRRAWNAATRLRRARRAARTGAGPGIQIDR